MHIMKYLYTQAKFYLYSILTARSIFSHSILNILEINFEQYYNVIIDNVCFDRVRLDWY